MTEHTDIMQKQDDIVKKWIMEITTVERVSKRMHNELELEQAKKTLVISELKREMLKVEELVKESMSRETNRLKTLMVNQLIEINKQEVLANIQRELKRLMGTFLKDLPEGASKSNELSKERKTEAEIVEIPSPKADFQPSERKVTIEGDIQRLEMEIAKGEKEQMNVQQCLVGHQELLDELKLLEEFTNRDEPPVPKVYGRNTQHLEAEVENPQVNHDKKNYDHIDSSNFNGNSTGRTNNATTVIASGVGEDAGQHAMIKKGTHYGPYTSAGKNSAFVLKTPKRMMNRIGPSCSFNKRTKLDLYDASEKTSKEPVAPKTDEGLKKMTQMFKPKTPSSLARRIVMKQ